VRFNVLGSVLDSDGRQDEAIQAFERGIAQDPDGALPSLRGNIGSVLYDRGEYERALEYWSAITPDFSEADALEYREWTGWLRRGTLAAIPDSARTFLSPEDWMKVREADSAAVALARGPENGLEFNWFYRFWDPIFDPIRSHPRVQSFLRERNLGGAKIQRTPAEDRQPLAVLRAVEAEGDE
jgi:tetratricopeptide (TPR) repeat protein